MRDHCALPLRRTPKKLPLDAIAKHLPTYVSQLLVLYIAVATAVAPIAAALEGCFSSSLQERILQTHLAGSAFEESGFCNEIYENFCGMP
jgi:hypothetical protein